MQTHTFYFFRFLTNDEILRRFPDPFSMISIKMHFLLSYHFPVVRIYIDLAAIVSASLVRRGGVQGKMVK